MTVRRPARLAAAGVTALAAAVLLTACNDDAGTGAQPAPTVTVTATTPAAPTSAGKVTVPGATPAGPMVTQSAGARCKADELEATVQLQDAGSAMLILTNKGSRSCTLFGYPGYGGLRPDNSADTIAVKREAHPGPPTAATLKPKTSAFAGLKWNSCDKADPTCHVVAGLQLTPPDETKPLTTEVIGLDGKPVVQLLVSAAGLTTGSLQPSNQGVVFAGP
ncbi:MULTISPECIES: DUF4232 domain-containing protein [unclassified Kitasatospora]|uniref:DUF4232 domain-containing protein n=1 Tax=unclassified Kitasatospora TaxID=2633591 RepID=UPI0033C542BB